MHLQNGEYRAWGGEDELVEASMWEELFVPQLPVAENVVRTVIVYALLLVLIRMTGKRGLASVNTLDVVVALLLVTVVQNAVIGDDITVIGGVVSAVVLVALNEGINPLVDVSPVAARVFRGRATTIIREGEVDYRALRRLRMSVSELDHAIRGQHGDDLAEIDHGQLTPSGQLILTLKRDEQSSTKADIAALADQLRRVEALLHERRAHQCGT